MLKTKAIRKLFITTLTAFILLVVYLIPTTINNVEEEVLRTNLEIEYITGIGTNNIYLLNKNNLLVRSKILLDTNDIEDQVKIILNNLIIKDNAKFPTGVVGTIPKKTKVLDIDYEDNIVTVDFSKEFLLMEEEIEKQVIESIVYSIMDLDNVNGVSIKVEDEDIEEYPYSKEELPEVLTKEIGINKKYSISSRQNINKIVIYYLEDIDSNRYYVPVTKYVNDSRDKIKIIVSELASSYIYEPNLMSFLNAKAELLNYEEKENIMFLNFNDYLFDSNNKVIEEVLYTLAYSVFENYDVNSVFIEVNGKLVEQIGLKDLK